MTALGAMISYAVAVPAAAQTDAPSAGKKKGDPNEMVCEKQEVLGTRLATKRVCKTRAEWAEQRRLQRSDLERTQVGGPTCRTGVGC
jgi:invasion protein IalB